MVEIGEYRAIKDTAMNLSGVAFLLSDGGKIKVEQIDDKNSKALVRCDDLVDWMHFSRIYKCFVNSKNYNPDSFTNRLFR